MQSIVAAEIGEEPAALRHFRRALLMDLADVAGNASDGVHVASAAGTWTALVHGFGGFRDHGGVLFVDLRDNYGITQVVAKAGSRALEILDGLRAESVVTVTGNLRWRWPGPP